MLMLIKLYIKNLIIVKIFLQLTYQNWSLTSDGVIDKLTIEIFYVKKFHMLNITAFRIFMDIVKLL
jgi:hypothetical protein